MKLFKTRGGVHPVYWKRYTQQEKIEILPMPPLLHLPLLQHIGAHAEPEVDRGDKVLKGQIVARAKGMISAPVHAPTSGTILGIHEFPAPHASGLSWQTITMKPDGEDRWGELPPPLDPLTATPDEIADRVAISGIVGMGGAAFPLAVKLNLGKVHKLDTLVINGSECEPYLTCDDRVMQERSDRVVEGIRAMARALMVPKTLIAIEKNKPDALIAMSDAVSDYDDISVVGIPTRYPMGAEKHLVQTVTGRETPAGKMTADIGVVVHNVATAFAVYEAIRFGRPLISRVVTISGSAVKNPKNIQAPIGTPIIHLLEHCGGFTTEPERILAGGPMMGQPLRSTRAPVVKGTSGILALTTKETRRRPAMPCIRCGSCVDACPCGLVPLEMAARIRKEELDGALSLGLMDCVSCGACSYSCPSYIPLAQYFNYAKGKVKANQADQRKQTLTKDIAEARLERIEREMKAKKEKLAQRKAEQAAKKKAQAEAKAGAEVEASSQPQADNDNVSKGTEA
jgi:electron transport complex protein RnfC